MDGQRFDAIAVMFAARSRRQILRAIAGTAVTGLAVALRGGGAGAEGKCASNDDCSKDPDAGQICLNGECCAKSRRCNNDTVCCSQGQWCTAEGCCPQARVCHEEGTTTNHCCAPCTECKGGKCQPCDLCDDCINGKCKKNDKKCRSCRPRGGGGGTGAAAVRALPAAAAVECGPCEECDPDQGCKPKACGACEVCNPTTSACVPKQCPACEACQGGACVAVDCGDPCLECVDNACVPKACGDCEECVGGACQAIDCGSPCLECSNNACPPKECDACAPCDPATGACTPIDCGDPCLVCKDGACRPTCETGQTCCEGDCVDTNSDPNNCGACDNACTDPLAPDCLDGACGCGSNTSCNYGGQSWCCTDVLPNGNCCCTGRITWPSTGQEVCNPCGIGTTFCYCNDGIGGWGCCRDGEVCAGCSGGDGSGVAVCAAPTSG
jgi:hypothetical protein